VLLTADKDDFRSQIRSISTQGTGGESQLSDGRSLELQPTYTPDGSQIVFSSNRAGKMSIWSMSATGAPGMTQLTLGDTNDLWPSVDADPKPRLYYERLVDTRPDPRLYMTQLGTTIRTDLTTQSGMQPRVNPKGDSIVFTHVNPKTGKRDIYRMSNKGGTMENHTNTPDDDESDPVWNRDGTKIAFASNRGMNEEKQHNYDIWVLDLSRSERAVQVSSNGSWDDCPAWDPNGGAIYFRSNRGGEWGIWKINVNFSNGHQSTQPDNK
jgi:Tol biopolymer transport system component